MRYPLLVLLLSLACWSSSCSKQLGSDPASSAGRDPGATPSSSLTPRPTAASDDPASPASDRAPGEPSSGGDPSAGSDPEATPADPGPVPPPASPTPPGTALNHRRCGWVLGDQSIQTFIANKEWFDAVHPDWYALNSDGVSVRALYSEGDPKLLAAAASAQVQVIPMVASVENVAWLRAMLNDPAKRSAHIKNLVAIAVGKGYPGLDLDYEKLWQASDRPVFTAFIQEASAAMHQAGKTLSIAIPGMEVETKGSGWSYQALAPLLDHLHIMGYDFHTVGTHAGPVSPLGWIEQVVEHAAATGYGQRFLLGLPNYGTTPSSYCSLADCPARCSGAISPSTTHMQSCSYGSQQPGRAPNCSTSSGQLFFDDTSSLEEKVAAAQAHGLRGITYWTVGAEAPGFFPMVKKHF